jgi:4-hydroxyacetophenone monooxygenase
VSSSQPIAEEPSDVSRTPAYAAIAQADSLALWAAVYQLTGDPRLRAVARDSTEASWERPRPADLADPADVSLLRRLAQEAYEKFQAGTIVAEPPSEESFAHVLEALLQEPVPREDLGWWWEEFAASPVPRAVGAISREAGSFEALIIGSGMMGLSVAVALKAAGIPFTIVEKNPGVGGTWYENTYPGARVDVASRSYSYTFEPKYRWRHYYALQSELAEYFEHITDKYGIRENIVYNTEVLGAQWNDADKRWNVDLRDMHGAVRKQSFPVVISAVGLFNRPSYPSIDGLQDFGGELIHSAKWNHAYDLTDKRVAIIGTGASGTQMVDQVASQVSQLHIFQRAGVWISDYKNYVAEVPDGEQWMLANFPFYVNWVRLLSSYSMGDKRMGVYDVDPAWQEAETVSEINSRVRESLVKYLMAQIGDRPDLVAKCIPDFPPLAKRLPKDNGWFAALKRDNVELVTDPIDKITEAGVVTKDGRLRTVDAIVLATGFRANDYLWPMRIEGSGGVTLEEAWRTDGARAYLGMVVPGFPNLFCMYGPNTNPKTGGPCMWGEMQARYIAQCLKFLIESDKASLEVREEVYESFNTVLDQRLANSIWMVQNQRSYYRNDHNRVAVNAPWATLEYWHMTLQPNLDDFLVTDL